MLLLTVGRNNDVFNIETTITKTHDLKRYYKIGVEKIGIDIEELCLKNNFIDTKTAKKFKGVEFYYMPNPDGSIDLNAEDYVNCWLFTAIAGGGNGKIIKQFSMNIGGYGLFSEKKD